MPSCHSAIRQVEGGVQIDVRVIPRAKKTEVGGVRDEAIFVRLAAPPVEGAANDALIDFLASLLRIRRRAIRIVSGSHSRRKRIAIDGVTAEAIRSLLV